jgi:putative intracellular protease/amidase
MYRTMGWGLGLALVAAVAAGNGARAEAEWASLLPKVEPSQAAVAGQWRKVGGALSVSAAEGARLMLPAAPQGEYDLRTTFTRGTGRDSVGLVVVQGGRQVVFEVDAWGSHLAGFQNIRGRSIRENPTRRENFPLENNRRYTMTVEVRKGLIRGLLDGKEVSSYRTDGGDVALPDLWSLPSPTHLGLVAWQSNTTFHAVELRMVSGTVDRSARATSPAPGTPAPRQPAESAPSPANARGGGKRVLMIIANHHFFFREYGDPRSEFERAGFRVTVAAGRKSPCDPHPGSGQNGSGVVQPDLALSEVRASDYDAVLFSGGWGASAYQYAFNGRYNYAPYNGDRATKAEANRIIGEFIAQDKYVAALCNGVSVLAWARVNGRSPLSGKRVCAPVREAAAGIYNGRPAQPSCRWHPESNGAILSPPGALGQPGTAADDVMVDGKILTGEDDISAREMGRRLVSLLR